MQKWEYCLVLQHHVGEFWIHWPDGEREKLKGSQEMVMANVLGKLGSEGWEAINWDPAGIERGIYTRFSHWPFRGNREFLFKRPLQE